MRVTFSTTMRAAMTDVNTTAENLAAKQLEVSSGLRVRVPSDDPAATVVAIGQQTELGTLSQFSRTADAATSRLSVADSVLSDMVTQLTAAKSATASVLVSTVTPSQTQAAVTQLQSIRDALVSDFNTSFSGSYLFAGSKATTPPFTETAGVVSAYQGDSSPVSVNIDRQITVATSLDGGQIAQGGAATDMFTDISNLITAIQTNNTAGINTGMTNLTAAFGRVVGAQTGVGISLQTLQAQQGRLTSAEQAATTQLSKAQDANMAQAISDMSSADTANRAALGAVATINKVSLLDYIG
ncbi:MAG TPA: flagellar hook-associated protein FlgL [Vicinamibacterales bacterium]|nr:flagellar hook-associated protein FlgL [Vicinamibacterales bacterium]